MAVFWFAVPPSLLGTGEARLLAAACSKEPRFSRANLTAAHFNLSCSARARSFALHSASSLLSLRVIDRRPELSSQ
jgi:hypothetical protein